MKVFKLGIVVFSLTWIGVSLKAKDEELDRCFCKLQGEVDDCSCKVESVDSFNNYKIYPSIKSLLAKDYFKYFKVNLYKGCPFWTNDEKCGMSCHVDSCKEEQLPKGFQTNRVHNKYSEEAQKESADCEVEAKSKLDTTISDKSREAFEDWRKHDDAQDNFCELDDENSADASYVDLQLNPERYTGYAGQSAHRIWRSIYTENCFKPDQKDYSNYLSQKAKSGADTNKNGQITTDSVWDQVLNIKPVLVCNYSCMEGMCLEKRAFFRMVSGLHSSITVHLCAMHYIPAKTPFGLGTWGPNVAEFRKRFGPEATGGEGPQRLKNLYFTYLVELRALAKIAPYLEQEIFYTGDEKNDQEVKQAVTGLLADIKSFKEHFDESKLFQGDPKQAKELKAAFKSHFRNISRIMDCVGCDKCRLWGKIQTQGLGTALKILFSGDEVGPLSTLDAGFKKKFQLRRSEIVSLFNAFGRLSRSISEIEEFRRLMR